MLKKIVLVVGTRPQIIKASPVIKRAEQYPELKLRTVNTGQHYDELMNEVFFKEFKLPDPIVNLRVGSGSHASQTGKMILELESVLVSESPDVVLIPGDTNSALAGAIVASKLGISVAHIESGARSYDMSMPEEINRRVVDHCSKLLFAVSRACVDNLKKERLDGLFTGDTMYEVLSSLLRTLAPNSACDSVFVTLHRPSNVDNRETLSKIVSELCNISEVMRVVFPVHPRTRENLRMFKLESLVKEKIELLDPLSYEETMRRMLASRVVITDSGGLQKESFWLRKLTITVRSTTEWIETLGLNRLVKPQDIYSTFCLLKDAGDVPQSSEYNPFLANRPASELILNTLSHLNG